MLQAIRKAPESSAVGFRQIVSFFFLSPFVYVCAREVSACQPEKEKGRGISRNAVVFHPAEQKQLTLVWTMKDSKARQKSTKIFYIDTTVWTFHLSASWHQGPLQIMIFYTTQLQVIKTKHIKFQVSPNKGVHFVNFIFSGYFLLQVWCF